MFPSWLAWISVAGLMIGIMFLWKGIAGPGIVRRIKCLVFGLLACAIGVLGLGLTAALRACEAFIRAVPVAEVRVAWAGPKRFDLTLTRVGRGAARREQTFPFIGDQWTISGGIIKWHPWLTAIGVPNYHHLSRISGGFTDAAQERAQPPTVEELDGGLGPAWWWLYRLDPYLPFIDAAYGSAAFMPADPAYLYEVDVTASGYLIRRTPADSRR